MQRQGIEAVEVHTPTADTSSVHSSAGFLEPVREFETSRLGTSRVAFPEADQRYPLGMYRYYERDQKPMMRAWLLRELAEWFALCPPIRSTALADHRDALIVAEQLAAEEIRRPLNTNEIRLLGEAVRDILTAKLVLPASAEQQREREIL